MAMGPQETRLRQALGGATLGEVRTSANDWMDAAAALDDVAAALKICGPEVEESFGGRTAPAAQAAFDKVSANVTERADQMRSAKGALDRAGDAIHDARQTRDSLGGEPTDPGAAPKPVQGQPDRDYLHGQLAHSRKVDGYHAEVDRREAVSRKAVDDMDAVHEQSAATMMRIHGEPDPVAQQPGSGGGSGPGVPGPGAGSPRSSEQPRASGVDATAPPRHQQDAPTPGGPGVAGQGDGRTPYPPAGPVIGTSQGAHPASPTIPAPSGPTPSGPTPSGPGIGGPSAGGLAGALGGGVMGGMAGIGGAVRGTGIVSTPAAGSTATGGRSIGSPGRSAGAARGGALGRGGVGAGSPAQRAGAPGSSRSAGRGAGGAAKPGGKGSAGSRSGAASGRGAANKAAKKAPAIDLFAHEQDWVDDEGAAPGVID